MSNKAPAHDNVESIRQWIHHAAHGEAERLMNSLLDIKWIQILLNFIVGSYTVNEMYISDSLWWN